MSLKEELREIKNDPRVQKQLKKAEIFSWLRVVFWIVSILILLYQVNTSNNNPDLNTIWAVTLILAIVFGVIARSIRRKAINLLADD